MDLVMRDFGNGIGGCNIRVEEGGLNGTDKLSKENHFGNIKEV